MALDDLLGLNITFSKLQDLLAQLIRSANDQEAAIKSIKDEAATTKNSLEKRLADQDATVARMREQAEASASQAAEALASIEASRAVLINQSKSVDEQIQDTARKLGPLEQRVCSLEALEATHVKRHQALQQGLEQGLATAETRIAGLEKAQVSGTKRLSELQEGLGGVTGKLARLQTLSDDVAELKQVASSHEERLAALARMEEAVTDLKQLTRGVTSFEAQFAEARTANDALLREAKAANEVVAARVGDLAAQVKADIDRLSAREAHDVRRLEDGLKAVQQDSNLRSLIQALSQRMDADIGPLRAQMAELAVRLNEFLSKGASATANCLCCGGKRSTKHDPFVLGTDGKTYFRAANGDTVGLGRLAGAASLPPMVVNAGSPSGGRRSSPARASTAMSSAARSYNLSASTPAL